MRMLRLALAVLATAFFISPSAKAAFELGDIICETTATTGTGTVNLAGAVTNYATFVSQIASGATVPYVLTSGDGKLETGLGVFTDATPDTLTRVANWSSDGSGAELTLSGTSRVCLGPNELMFSAPDVQTMSSTGSGDSWDKPTGGQTMCLVELWGGGGSGGKGAAAAAPGGGGGGAYKAKFFRIADLAATEQVTVATGGTSQTTASTDGNVGGSTTFGTSGTLVTAYGGGGGDLGATGGGGGGGGGSRNVGGAGNTITGGTSDLLPGTVGNLNTGPYGTPGGNGVATGNAATPISAFYGGAGGGGSTGDATGTNAPGGASEFGGGGGGAGAEDVAPGPGAGGASSYGGAGGAGAFDASNGTGGTQPGGGGGGAETGNSGAGGNGRARITCW